MHATFNAYHLGDNLVHLNFLRKLAQKYPDREFAHWAADHHIPQLSPLQEDLPNLSLRIGDYPSEALNSWRGAGNYWYAHPQRNDFVAFHLDWFAHLAGKMGLESPMTQASDFLFDYPALISQAEGFAKQGVGFDYLVINSQPHSGQFRQYDQYGFDLLILRLLAGGNSVVTTAPTGITQLRDGVVHDCTQDGKTGMSVTAIGGLSFWCRNIVGVATGPIWTTFNFWNQNSRRIIMLDEERLDIVPGVHHVRSCAEAEAIIFQ